MGQYDQAQMGGPLPDAIRNTIDSYTQMMIRNGQINQFEGASVTSYLHQNVSSIINNLVQMYPQAVPVPAIQNAVASCAASAIAQIRQNQSPHGMQQTTMNPQNLNSQSLFPTSGYQSNQGPSFNQPSPQPFTLLSNQQPAPPPPPAAPVKQPNTGSIRWCDSNDPEVRYDFSRDNNFNRYSIKLNDHAKLLEVTAKATMISNADDPDKMERYNYSSVDVIIPEPSQRRVIRNFIATNPSLVIGKYIADINYDQFLLKRARAKNITPIDISSLNNAINQEVSTTFMIEKVIKSISEHESSVAKTIEELIVKHFNDLIGRFLRIKTNIGLHLKIEELTDVILLLNQKKEKYKDLTNARGYEEIIFKSFKWSVTRVITDETKTGFYDTADIAPHLLVHPDFVIREEGICDRELDTTKPEFIEAIRRRYTAFCNTDNIVITNFIPKSLDVDIVNHAICIDKITNPIDYLIVNEWREKPKTVLMTDGDRQILIKNGVTVDGYRFIFEDKIDLDYGITTL